MRAKDYSPLRYPLEIYVFLGNRSLCVGANNLSPVLSAAYYLLNIRRVF